MKHEDVEKLRKSALNYLKLIGISFLLMSFGGAIHLALGFIVIIFMFYFIIKYLNQTKAFKKSYKEVFVKEAMDKIFTDVNFHFGYGMDENLIKETNMIQMGNRFYSNDYITGKYKGINFIYSDVTIDKVVSTGKTSRTINYFTGQWMIFDFNKNFKANIQVKEGNFKYAKNNTLFNNQYKKIEFEDMDFNYLYDVYAISELEAFYIITPNLITKLKELEKNTNADIMFCFINNKLHVALHNKKDNFEHNMMKPVIYDEVIKIINYEINLITSFVDTLNLEVDIFKKEV